MGQQQLLILGVAILLVTVAVAAGTLMFGENQEKTLYENITSEGLKMAADAVEWKRTTDATGSMNEAKYLDGLTLGKLGYEETNEKGTDTDHYTRELNSTDSERPYFEIEPKTKKNMRVRVFMYGPSSDCIKVQRARKINGKWKNAGMDVGKNSHPVGCTVW